MTDNRTAQIVGSLILAGLIVILTVVIVSARIPAGGLDDDRREEYRELREERLEERQDRLEDRD